MKLDELEEFLLWFKECSEATWAGYRTSSLADLKARGVGGSDWRRGTKWQQGFSAAEIKQVETAWNIQFPPDYRVFLSVLNAPDRRQFNTRWSSEPSHDLRQTEDTPSFYDWRRDTAQLQAALNWPLEGLEFDLEHADLWRDSWGPRPESLDDRKAKLAELVRAAPKLVPIFGHRYLLGEPLVAGNPVLSVYQSDIVIYGVDLIDYLQKDFPELFGFDPNELWEDPSDASTDEDFESDSASLEPGPDELPVPSSKTITNEDIRIIPFWGELMT